MLLLKRSGLIRSPGRARYVLARWAAVGRIGMTVIERAVPEVPDRQVQLADGFLDLRHSRMVTAQSQCRFESEPSGE